MRKNVWCEGVVYDVLGGVVGGMAGNIFNTCAYHHYLHMMNTQIKSNLDSKIISVYIPTSDFTFNFEHFPGLP